MNALNSDIHCDLMIIGTGLSGMAAALFAANRGINAVQVGQTSGIGFASGLLDLMAVFPVSDKKVWANPWQAITKLVNDIPNHPYAYIEKAQIEHALDEFVEFLNQDGDIGYTCHKDRNANAITCMGTIKHSYYVPISMWPGVEALNQKANCLIVDFHGLKGFSAAQIKEALRPKWPNLRTARISFPESKGEIYPEHMAKALDNPVICEKLIHSIFPHLSNAAYVGFPAILGLSRNREIMANIEKRLGVGVFEIPTMPPSIPGIRLKKAFEQKLPEKGICTLFQQNVLDVTSNGNGDMVFSVGHKQAETTVRAKAAILASGRFFGKGLWATRSGVRETIFNLPVYQSRQRKQWHQDNFFDPGGHPINTTGIEIDHYFRPVNNNKQPVFPNLFAAGSILGHQDWVRMKCGAGLAVATAYAAIEAYLNFMC